MGYSGHELRAIHALDEIITEYSSKYNRKYNSCNHVSFGYYLNIYYRNCFTLTL